MNEKKLKSEVNRFGIHDIMLGTKEELGRGAFGEMCLYLQPAAKLCCFSLPDVPLYLKSH